MRKKQRARTEKRALHKDGGERMQSAPAGLVKWWSEKRQVKIAETIQRQYDGNAPRRRNQR